MTRVSWTVLLLTSALLSTACATRHLPEAQRQECRQLRGKAAARGIFMPVGIAVVALFYVFAEAAADGDGDSEARTKRRRERRRHRREVCRDIQRTLPPSTVVASESTSSAVLLPPPDEAALGAALRSVEAELRACVPDARGLLILDAGLHGRAGRVTSFELEGEGVAPGHRACVETVMRRVRFDPFDGAMRVRWSINLSNQRLPVPWESEGSEASE